MAKNDTASLTPEQANDVKNSDAYSFQGTKFPLPDGFTVAREDLPDWRLAHFAVILPVFPGALTSMDDTEWAPGRFRGIKSIEVPVWDAEAAAYRRATDIPRHLLDKAAYHYTPRVFLKGAHSRFRSPLDESVGAEAVDAVGGASECSPKHTRHKTSVCARRLLFRPDITPENGKTPPEDPRQKTRPGAEFVLVDDPEVLAAVGGSTRNLERFQGRALHNPHARISLACVEHLQYSGPGLRRIGTEDTEGTEGTANTANTAFQNDFLVFHVVAEHCSSAALEAISKSLFRSRNRVPLLPEYTPNPTHITEVRKENLLSLLLARFGETIGNTSLAFGNGGGLRWAQEKDGLTAGNPYTTITAIPAREGLELPQRMQQPGEQDLGPWTVHDAWAWFLATRADLFQPELTALDQHSLDASRVQLFRDWTVHSDENGLAVVRRAPIENANNFFWIHTGTRLVDLAILVRRADKYLAQMAKQLRAMTFGSTEIDQLRLKDEWSDDDIQKASSTLRRSLRNFEALQTELVVFRDHLWYESVSGRPVDTAVLRHMLLATGTRDNFDEIVSELELRKDIYATQADSIQVALDTVRRQKAQEKEEREKEQERQERRREAEEQERREALNINIAIAGLALAVPGLIDLWPRADDSHTEFWISLVVVLAIGAVLFSRLRSQGVFGRKD
ncbi:hypothetical protein [Corynebacterium sp. HMSC074A01]|uniref:hypothetical protein n=1 Tax=Corynebacterium sp. HMSC074A01 TaxID=1715030 RepID=UPI0008A476D6|nr:hypothetical protein [Corynebacterium sp. HMSC074A01]OHF41042.1 hypothetical protein HMPREF2550_00295 [Corynebacterium sp. HMSC074A01]